MKKYCPEVIAETLFNMTPELRRGWIIRLLMAARGLTLAAISRRRRLTVAYLSGALIGRFPWRRRILETFEGELGMDFTDLLLPEEAKKLGCQMGDKAE